MGTVGEAEPRRRLGQAAHDSGTGGGSVDHTPTPRPRRPPVVVLVLQLLAVAVCTVGLCSYAVFYVNWQLKLGRFFRDVSRAKTHARKHGAANAVSAVFGDVIDTKEIPVPGLFDDGGHVEATAVDDGDILRLTPEELAEYNGEKGSPIYLSIYGRIYDVTKGKTFYGPGRSYHHYVGRDATRSFATGCTRAECLTHSVVGLTQREKMEAYKWLELFEFHDKYKFIGILSSSNMDDLVEKAFLESEAQLYGNNVPLDSDESRLSAVKDAIVEYKAGNFDKSMELFKRALILIGEATDQGERPSAIQRAEVLIVMAAISSKQAKNGVAVQFATEAHEGLREALGPDEADQHPLYARILSDSGTLRFMDGDADAGMADMTQGIAVFRRVLKTTSKDRRDEDERFYKTSAIELRNTMLNLGQLLLDVDPNKMPDAFESAAALFNELAAEHDLDKEGAQNPKALAMMDQIREKAKKLG